MDKDDLNRQADAEIAGLVRDLTSSDEATRADAAEKAHLAEKLLKGIDRKKK
ncbi:hypothetical protein NOGI109294_23155 [Nocardiopsis gilva]|uniref:hypothetical protein n=1 Tax=Nocardiopsis gilva TaxID=280236 RepID=UPI0003483ECF|nr:hypothetical protein [Nocardiopsis gilva]